MTMSYLEDRYKDHATSYDDVDEIITDSGDDWDLNEVRREAVKEFVESLYSTTSDEDSSLRAAVIGNLPALFDEDGEEVKDDVVDDACKAAQEWFGAE